MAETRVLLPTLTSLRDKFVNDVRRLKIRAGVARPNVAPGSESYIKGEAVAAAALELHAKLAAIQDAQMPDSAEGEDLERLADVWKGLKKSSGAGASGYAKVSCSGSVTYAQGQECTTPDGLRYEVVITSKVANGELVAIKGKDTGKRTDKPSGTVLTWKSPPSGSAATAVVSNAGLVNGKDADTDSTFRARLLDALRHPAASGSWAHYAAWAESASASIQKAFVYPAAQGPGTVHVAICVAAEAENYYTREASASLVNQAAMKIVENSPEPADVTVHSVVDAAGDVVMQLALPATLVDGGQGGGWKDSTGTRWPAVGGAAPFATRLAAAPISSTVLRVTTYTAPTANTYIAIWSNSKKKFVHARVKSSALVSGSNYDITLHESIDTGILASGDYVSPDAEKLDDYGHTMAELFGKLGPGEKTSDANLLPRAYRHPLTNESWSHQLTSKDIGKLSLTHEEIEHVTVSAPTLPAAVNAAASITSGPYIGVLGKLAFYPV